MFFLIWDHHQVRQEPPCPPRPQEETWRTGGVLTGFLMSNIHETFRETSLGCSHPSETITRCIILLHQILIKWATTVFILYTYIHDLMILHIIISYVNFSLYHNWLWYITLTYWIENYYLNNSCKGGVNPPTKKPHLGATIMFNPNF